MVKKYMKTIGFVLVALVFLVAGNSYAETEVFSQEGATYVGAAKCRDCHEKIYEGWKTTFHFYKFQDVTPDRVVADFEKNNTLEAGGYTTRMSRRGDNFYITTKGPDDQEHTYMAKYMIGSVWKQRYVTEFPNGALHILPVQWNVKTQEWVDYHGLKKYKPDSGKYWSDKVRTYQFKCTGCHNTGSQFTYDKNTDTFSGTMWVDKGVACEACHGPGDISSHSFKVLPPSQTMKLGKKESNSCNLCHYHKDDSPEKFQKVLDSIKKKGWANYK